MFGRRVCAAIVPARKSNAAKLVIVRVVWRSMSGTHSLLLD